MRWPARAIGITSIALSNSGRRIRRFARYVSHPTSIPPFRDVERIAQSCRPDLTHLWVPALHDEAAKSDQRLRAVESLPDDTSGREVHDQTIRDIWRRYTTVHAQPKHPRTAREQADGKAKVVHGFERWDLLA